MTGPDRFFAISGCSGGGKSSVIAELRRCGYVTVDEPGRRIVRAETDPASPRLPWNDAATFSDAAIAMAQDDLHRAGTMPGPVFFDRGLIDALAGKAHATGEAIPAVPAARRYNASVFLAPPWPEIHAVDAERRHSLADAEAGYDRLSRVYPALGDRVEILPEVSVAARADFVLERVRV